MPRSLNVLRLVYLSILMTFLSGYRSTPANSLTSAAPPATAAEAVSQPIKSTALAFRPPVARRWGLRRSPVCPITPGFYDEPLLSATPTFVWAEKFATGSVSKIAVSLNDSETELWSQAVAQSASAPRSTAAEWAFQQISYTGEALQPGQNYRWIMFDRLDREIVSIPFQIRTPAQRDRFSAELAALEERLTQEGKTTEDIAWQQANYLADNQLWSDALQVAFLIANPSPEQVAWRHQIAAELCEA